MTGGTPKPTAARDVPQGTVWTFPEHRTLADAMEDAARASFAPCPWIPAAFTMILHGPGGAERLRVHGHARSPMPGSALGPFGVARWLLGGEPCASVWPVVHTPSGAAVGWGWDRISARAFADALMGLGDWGCADPAAYQGRADAVAALRKRFCIIGRMDAVLCG